MDQLIDTYNAHCNELKSLRTIAAHDNPPQETLEYLNAKIKEVQFQKLCAAADLTDERLATMAYEAAKSERKAEQCQVRCWLIFLLSILATVLIVLAFMMGMIVNDANKMSQVKLLKEEIRILTEEVAAHQMMTPGQVGLENSPLAGVTLPQLAVASFFIAGVPVFMSSISERWIKLSLQTNLKSTKKNDKAQDNTEKDEAQSPNIARDTSSSKSEEQ